MTDVLAKASNLELLKSSACFVCRDVTPLDPSSGVESLKTNFMLQNLVATISLARSRSMSHGGLVGGTGGGGGVGGGGVAGSLVPFLISLMSVFAMKEPLVLIFASTVLKAPRIKPRCFALNAKSRSAPLALKFM